MIQLFALVPALLFTAADSAAPCPACRSESTAPAFVRPAGKLDTAQIETATGLKGSFSEGENTFKVTQPRKDVAIEVDGRVMEPFMGFTSWATFAPGKIAPAMLAGDLVLFQDEVAPVMDALFAHGLRATALHNHFFFTKPVVYFMHIGGEGESKALAEGVKAALDAIKAQRQKAGDPAAVSGFGGPAVAAKNDIPAAALDSALEVKGQAKDGMYKAVWGRSVSMACGCSAGKEMGVNTWAAFAGDATAACVDGDFLTFDGELQPVLKSLRSSGIHIVSIHSHMEGENPKAIFLHYWGKGNAVDLAKAVKKALDAQQAAGK